MSELYENSSYKDFKKTCSEFFKNIDADTTLDQAIAGQKTINLMWLCREDDWTDIEIQESVRLLDMIGGKVIDIEVAEKLSRHEFDISLNEEYALQMQYEYIDEGGV